MNRSLWLAGGLFALLTHPCMGAGLGNWSYEPLRDDVKMSDVFELDVVSISDQPVGRMRNILIGDDGSFEAASIEFSQADGRAFALALVEWSDVVVEPEAEEVTVALGSGVSEKGGEENIARQGMTVRELIGLPVTLEGKAFGKISDVLFEPGDSRPSAYLVENPQGKIYALPPRAGADSVNYSLAREEVEKLGPFPS